MINNMASHNIENSPNNDNSDLDEDPLTQELHGWLMKRTRLARKWERKWFAVRKGEMVYGTHEGIVEKRIPLSGAQIAESSPDRRIYAFKIRPKDSKRVYYMHADSEEHQRDWMQAICFAKAAGGRTDQSEACTIQ